MKAALEQLRLQCSDWNIAIGSRALRLLGSYAELLAEYRLANVVGTKDRDQIIEQHLLDSLSCLRVAALEEAASIVDVGSGGGLPGIPLSIVRPKVGVNLLEATEKKVRFLEHAQAELKLPHLRVIHARAEEAGRNPSYRETFDVAITRALAQLPVVLEYCAPLIRREGKIICMKAKLSEEELQAGEAASSELKVGLLEEQEVAYGPSLLQKERRLLVFEKASTTPKTFPRRVGLAKKRPLGT